jgi:hypothetical protein
MEFNIKTKLLKHTIIPKDSKEQISLLILLPRDLLSQTSMTIHQLTAARFSEVSQQILITIITCSNLKPTTILSL